MNNKKLIFIACGQREDHEKKLGKDICEFIKKTYSNLDCFLAEDTHTFNGLTSEIFGNLNNCSGFIAIMHRREKYSKDNNKFYSSLWINQEISIAAFLALRDKRNIPMRIFIESDAQGSVQVEGVLSYLMANPIPFANSESVIEEVKSWLEQTIFTDQEKIEEYLLQGKRKITLLSGYTGELHTYRLDFEIANLGKKTATDVSLEFCFPKGLSPKQFNSRLFDRFESREREDFYTFNLKNNIPKILPGKSETIYCFDFIVNHNIYFDGYTHKNIKWKIFADNMSPIEDEVPLEGPMGEGINF